MSALPTFSRFAAIDWSGAKGRRHKGIAIAMAEAGDKAPRLVPHDGPWSRSEVLDWLLETSAQAPTLYGFDFSYAPPIAERGAYFPGEAAPPSEAKSFWAYVDRLCQDEDLGAASFLEEHHRPHFYFGAADGAGIGDRFLGHIERCRVLLHLVDANNEDVAEAYRTVRDELEIYGAGLAEKPEVLALNKADTLDDELLEALGGELEGEAGVKPYRLSGATGAGSEAVLDALLAHIDAEKETGEDEAEAWTPL